MKKNGLRIRCGKIHPEVKGAMLRFSKWLRLNYDFPKRVTVYIKPEVMLIANDGSRCSATFFMYFDNSPPFIRVATGDYLELKKKVGRDNALAAQLESFAHEFVHYQQWLKNRNIHEYGVIKAASRLIDQYSQTTDHP